MSRKRVDWRKCKRCDVTFARGRGASGQFCTVQCAGAAHRQTIDADVLAEYVRSGTPMLQIASELHVTRGFVRAVMHRQGVYRAWYKRRFKKCATEERVHFLKAGLTSAITASATATTPSARSELRTA